MTLPNDAPLQKIQFYVTAPYSCGYLEGKLAQSLIAAPHHLIDAGAYNGLIQLGFRRSGKFAYRPHCESCSACVPVRVLVDEFSASRSQRRARQQHANLSAAIVPLAFSEEHFALYQAYQIARHEGQQEPDSVEQYRNFLVQSNVDSKLIEFRLNGELMMVSLVDIVHDGISAVYTFYNTTDRHCSYGTYNILWLIDWAGQLGLKHLYLGYWIEQSRKMAYKQNFLPQEALIDCEWLRLNKPNKK
jgi:arginine-tRNA-protein transferase